MTGSEPTPERPTYRKVRPNGSRLFHIVCDEGWRESIVCTGMYEWAADWLISVLDGRPYAPESRP